MAAEQIVGPFCWNCESTEHSWGSCPKPKDAAAIAKNRTLYREHKDTRDSAAGRGDVLQVKTDWTKKKLNCPHYL